MNIEHGSLLQGNTAERKDTMRRCTEYMKHEAPCSNHAIKMTVVSPC
jgi:hypothetical protein